MITIGIDIRTLGSGQKSGIEEYTENLLSHMLPLDKRLKFKLFSISFRNISYDYDWLSLPNVEVYRFRFPNRLLFFTSGSLNRPRADELMGEVDVFFSPHFFLTALSSGCKRITTFHDLSYVHFPEFFSWRKNIWHNFEMKPSWQSRFSDRIIAVSESTKNDLINLYQVDPAKISIVHSGIAEDIKRPTDVELENFRKQNNLPGRFILFLGKLEPRKNIPSIIKAFNMVKNKNEFQDLRLILVGSRGWLYGDIFREIRSSGYKNDILLKDHISDVDRKFYYSLAKAFVYPSFFEGFGFPPLEAMACGTPVITSNRSSLPEVVRNGAVLTDPHNVSDIASALLLILRNKEFRKDIIRRGASIAGSFNWTRAAEKTLDCILR